MARVLIVDDDKDTRDILETIVKREGHEALTASDAEEAWKLLGQPLALMLLDVDLPGETGVEMLFRMRGSKEFKDVQVVFVTAFPERAGPLQLTGCGASDVIPKPFRQNDVVNVIRRLLKI